MAGFKRRTLQELLSVDINKLTKSELQGYKKVARDELARTLKRWEGREYKSPAYYAFEKATGGTNKISFRGKQTLQQQKKELQKAITFLSDKTRTVAGWEEEKKSNLNKVNAHFKERSGFDTVDFDRLYSAYQKAREIDKNLESQEFRYAVWESMIDRLKDETVDIDQLAVEMAERIQDVYEEKEKEHQRNQRNRSRTYRKKKK